MSVIALVLALAALALVVVAIQAVIAASGRDPALDEVLAEDDASHELRELLTRKAMLMQLIRSAELDHEMGRTSDDEAKRLNERYRREAVQVMRKLDRLRGEEVDRARAEALVDEIAQRVEDTYDGGESWSPAARRRHAGREPLSVPE